jgi:epoxyqueuosine reductase
MGSFFFIAELVLDVELAYDGPMEDYCGTCTRCVDACPTEAISQPYVVDGSRCISYLTIELKENIPTEFKGQIENWVFGCDICQDVCPWNRFSRAHTTPEFLPNTYLMEWKDADWEFMTEEAFRKTFQKSALKRAKYAGVKRNVEFIKPTKEVL